jgi:plastocyanin
MFNSKSKLMFLVLLLVVVAAFSAACGPGGGGGGNTLNITVNASEFKFDPPTINATAGQKVTVTLKNTGTVQHTFVLKDANVSLKADPGATDSATFTAPAAGTYQYECDIAGHKEAGMIGQLIVK